MAQRVAACLMASVFFCLISRISSKFHQVCMVCRTMKTNHSFNGVLIVCKPYTLPLESARLLCRRLSSYRSVTLKVLISDLFLKLFYNKPLQLLIGFFKIPSLICLLISLTWLSKAPTGLILFLPLPAITAPLCIQYLNQSCALHRLRLLGSQRFYHQTIFYLFQQQVLVH